MTVKYNKDMDVLRIAFNENKISESNEKKHGIILDYDKSGTIVSIEVLDASKKMKETAQVEFEIA